MKYSSIIGLIIAFILFVRLLICGIKEWDKD